VPAQTYPPSGVSVSSTQVRSAGGGIVGGSWMMSARWRTTALLVAV
jgi:hypothetical protein